MTIDEGQLRAWPHELHEWVRAQWASWTGLAMPPGLILTVRGRKAGRVTLLVSPSGVGVAPAVVVKVSTERSDRPNVEAEYRALEQVRRLPAGDQVRVPAPLGMCDLPGAVAIAMEAMHGRRIYPPSLHHVGPFGRRLLRRYVRKVGSLGHALATASSPRPADGLGSLADLVDAFGSDCAQRGTASRAHALAASLRTANLKWPGVWQHGDPAFANVLVDGAEVTLIDWETARPDYPPWFDLGSVPAFLLHAAAVEDVPKPSSTKIPELLNDGIGRLLRAELLALWRYNMPIAWAVRICAIHLALRPTAEGGPPDPYSMLIAAALVDDERWLDPRKF